MQCESTSLEVSGPRCVGVEFRKFGFCVRLLVFFASPLAHRCGGAVALPRRGAKPLISGQQSFLVRGVGFPRCCQIQVNLGRFQAPIYVANRQLAQFSTKAFLYNAAALELGFRGADRRKPPKPPPADPAPAAPAPDAGPADLAEPAKKTLKVLSHEGWCPEAANMLDRAAYLYGQRDNYFTQRLMVRCLTPTSEWHSRCVGCWLTKGIFTISLLSSLAALPSSLPRLDGSVTIFRMTRGLGTTLSFSHPFVRNAISGPSALESA